MKNALMLVGALCCATLPVHATRNPIAEAPEITGGLTPAQASDWMGVQVQHADAVNRFGANSQKASDAKVRMESFSQSLGIDQMAAAPERKSSSLDMRDVTVIREPDFVASTTP